jgi:hypothetical protein
VQIDGELRTVSAGPVFAQSPNPFPIGAVVSASVLAEVLAAMGKGSRNLASNSFSMDAVGPYSS